MAAITSAVVVAGATAYSANKQSKAAKEAGQMGAQAASDSNQLQWNMYQQSRQDAEPWRQAGLSGLQSYMSLLKPQTDLRGAMPDNLFSMENGVPTMNAQAYANNAAYKQAWDTLDTQHRARYGTGYTAASDPNVLRSQLESAYATAADPWAQFRQQPGYQFRMDEGQRALESGAAANGGLFSGKAGKALVQYGQGVADQTYNDTLNRYAALSGIGQTQTQANANYGQQVTQQMGKNLQTAAAQRASGLQQSAQAQGQGAQALAGAFGYGLNAWAQNRGGR